MNVLEGLKALYSANGGDATDLDILSGNKDANVISTIYGDGVNEKLPKELEQNIIEMSSGDSGTNTIIGFDDMPTLYATSPATSDPTAQENMSNSVGFGLLENATDTTPMTVTQLNALMSSTGTMPVKIYVPNEQGFVITNRTDQSDSFTAFWIFNGDTFGCSFHYPQ